VAYAPELSVRAAAVAAPAADLGTLLDDDIGNVSGVTIGSYAFAAYQQAYAAQNHLEYFAELSCAYFVGCNYAPFNRAELKEYDPAGFALIEALWQANGP